MENMHVKYSNITKATLVQYYKENFTAKESRKEKIGRYLYELARLSICGMAIYYLDSPIWETVKAFRLDDATGSYASRLAAAGATTILIWLIGLAAYFAVTGQGCKIIFPTSAKKWREKDIQKEFQYKYNDIFDFQEILKNKDVERITTDGLSKIKVEYKGKNQITYSATADLRSHYSDTVTHDAINFEWIDEEINKELRNNGYEEITEGGIYENRETM